MRFCWAVIESSESVIVKCFSSRRAEHSEGFLKHLLALSGLI